MLVPAIHVLAAISTASRGWPGQARPRHNGNDRALCPIKLAPMGTRPAMTAREARPPVPVICLNLPAVCCSLTSRFPRVDLAHLPTRVEPMRRLGAGLGLDALWVKRDDCTGL